jgi:hypothetical protein
LEDWWTGVLITDELPQVPGSDGCGLRPYPAEHNSKELILAYACVTARLDLDVRTFDCVRCGLRGARRCADFTAAAQGCLHRRDGQEIQGLGWTDGRNIRVEHRVVVGAGPEIAQTYAAELVGLPSDIIVAGGATTVTAVRRESRTIPVVFLNVADRVAPRLRPRAVSRGVRGLLGFSCARQGLGVSAQYGNSL